MARQFLTPIRVVAQPTPSTPDSGFTLFAQSSSNALSWIGANGFTRTIDGTANTANRIYTLPDASGQFVLSGLIGSSGLTMTAGRVLIGPALGTGPPQEATLAGLIIVSNLLAALSDPVIALASPTAGPTAPAVLEVFGDFAYNFIFSSSTAVPVWSCDIGAPATGAAIQLDIRISLSGTYTSIFSTLPTIAVGANTSRGATGGTFSTAFINGTGGFTALTIPQGASVRFQCTQASTGGGAGLKCQLIGRRGG
jgi:hypothetical protein